MNDLSNGVVTEKHGRGGLEPIPSLAIFTLVPLFLVGLSVSIFFLVAVRNASFFVAFALLSSLVLSFILWNTRSFATKASVSRFLSSLPDADLTQAKHGQLVKITGSASCGTVSLESSYERANRCIYASTVLYEHGGFKVNMSCFKWSLSYCERFSTDFYITDKKSGLRAIVKAGSGCRVVPLIPENELVNTARSHRAALSPTLRKWLRERNLSDDPRVLRLEEGYVQEGSTVSVVGTVIRDDGMTAIVEPPEVVSTGCLWRKLLLPVDIDGLVLGVSKTTNDVSMDRNSVQNLDCSRTV